MANATVLSDPPVGDEIIQRWTDATGWVLGHGAQIALAAMLGALIVGILCAAKWLGERLCADDPDRRHWRTTVGKALAKTRLWFMVAVAAQVVAAFGHAPADLAHTINFGFVIATTWQAAIFARALILGVVEHRASGHEALESAIGIIRLLVTIALFAIASVLILSNLGVDVTGLIAGLGIGGIAIGLAAQGIFKDLFAALAILLDQPFRVADLIKFGDVTGRVEAIGLKTTRVRSLDGEEVIVSNDRLLDQQIRNFHGIEQRRILITLPLHHANSTEKLALLPAALQGVVAGIADSKFDHALLTECTATAVVLELMLHSTTGTADVRDRVRHQAIVATLGYLENARIALSSQPIDRPFPA